MDMMTRAPVSFAALTRVLVRPLATAGRSNAPRLSPQRRAISSSTTWEHENPLGLPRSGTSPPPTMPRRGKGGPPEKRPIPHVKKVVAVASGKGGVGKSTVAANLALALSLTANSPRRVGLLDLDIFGPSVPKLMGLEDAGEPELTEAGALLPLTNHSIPCMSMGFLLPPSAGGSNADTPVVWRGLMVMKAVQQLLFDVDWGASARAAPTSVGTGGGDGAAGQESGDGLDVLVIDMPPGTGDVALSLSQLVKVDGAVIVSTPQDVALVDARKGVSMFQKVDVPILGLVLNMTHFICPSCSTPHPLFGPSTSFDALADKLRAPVLGRIPVEPDVSSGGDRGWPVVLKGERREGVEGAKAVFEGVGRQVWQRLGM